MKATSPLVWIGLGFLGILVASAASADVIQLQNGDQITGTFKEAAAGIVSIEVDGQVKTVPQDKVRAIYLGSPPARPTDVRNGALGEALDALQGLQAVAAAGVDYKEYASRVVDAKVKVDRFLASAPSDSTARGAVARSMRFYDLASMAWSGRVSGSLDQFPGVGRDPLLQQCDEAQDVLRKYVPHRGSDQIFGEGYSDGLAIALSGLPALWSCASRETAAAVHAAAPSSVAVPASSISSQEPSARVRSADCPAGFALNDTKKMCVRQ
jgi:hypothetical protein